MNLGCGGMNDQPDRETAWNERSIPESRKPSAAEDGALVYDPVAHRVLLFGGKNDQDENLNEVWEFDLSQNRWRQLDVVGDRPLGREDHVAIFDPQGYRLIIHGGENDTPVSNEIWALDLRERTWSDLTSADSPAREDHTAIYDARGKRMILFGGRRDRDEVWSFDLDPQSPEFQSWRNLTPAENNPPGRVDHVALYDSVRNRMLIHGGWDKNEKQYFNDTWAYFLPSKPDTVGRWEVLRTGPMRPPKRRHAAGVHDVARDRLLVFGGMGEEGYSNAVWGLDLRLDRWRDLTPGPEPRIDHQAVFDPRSGNLLIYGGDGIRSGKLHDLWELPLGLESPPAPEP
jgi:hypothetical protein